MATIVIDDEAYHRLVTAKREEESLSQTIKRVVPPPLDVEAWLKKLESDPASDEFVAAVEQQVANRQPGATRER